MIHETAQVVTVADGAVYVDCASRSSCQRCAEGRGCGGAIMGRLLGERQHRVRVHIENGVPKPGDRVVLSLNEAVILRGALLAYLLPLAGLLLGAVCGQYLGSETRAMTGAGLGFLAAWGAARLLAGRFLADWQPAARLQ